MYVMVQSSLNLPSSPAPSETRWYRSHSAAVCSYPRSPGVAHGATSQPGTSKTAVIPECLISSVACQQETLTLPGFLMPLQNICNPEFTSVLMGILWFCQAPLDFDTWKQIGISLMFIFHVITMYKYTWNTISKKSGQKSLGQSFYIIWFTNFFA